MNSFLTFFLLHELCGMFFNILGHNTCSARPWSIKKILFANPTQILTRNTFADVSRCFTKNDKLSSHCELSKVL